MDTITHGIAGALIGKAFFADRAIGAAARKGTAGQPGVAKTQDAARLAGRVAILATTLGAVFPDVDVFLYRFSPLGLGVLEIHRGPTHSLVCLPLFAVGLAGATLGLTRWRRWATPSFWPLVGVYAASLALHIVMDLITSFGTMIWNPLARTRVSWDLVFILDFILSGIVLLPQVAAWIYSKRRAALGGIPIVAWLMWLVMTAFAAGVIGLSRAIGIASSWRAAAVVSIVLAVLLLVPGRGGRGLRVRRATWCRAGAAVMAGYLLLCAVVHQRALGRVERFAAERGLDVERLGALPMPPALTRWSGLIRTPNGVHHAVFSVLDGQPPEFRFTADAPANGFTESVRRLPEVQTYLWFARFPVMRYSSQGDRHIVEFTDLRFSRRPGDERTGAFSYRVALDAAGNVLDQGWLLD